MDNPFLNQPIPGLPQAGTQLPGTEALGAGRENPFLNSPAGQPAADVGGWEKFLTALTEDTTLQQTLMQAGAAMLAPAAPGTGTSGRIGAGINAGVNAYNQGRDREFQREALGARQANAERRTDLQERQVEVGEENTELRAEDQRLRRADFASEDEYRKAKLALDKSLAASLMTYREAQTAELGADKLSGQQNQIAGQLMEAWKADGTYDSFGSEGAAKTEAFRVAQALMSSKTPEEFKLKVDEVYENIISFARGEPERQEDLRQQKQVLIDDFNARMSVTPNIPEGSSAGASPPNADPIVVGAPGEEKAPMAVRWKQVQELGWTGEQFLEWVRMQTKGNPSAMAQARKLTGVP